MKTQIPHDLNGYKRILLFGGSFDPPHHAHVILPQQVAKKIGADLIVYIPAGRAPHKLEIQQTAAEHRLAMLRLALEGEPNDTIYTGEIDRGEDEPSYTVDTLRRLREQTRVGVVFRLLIGADQLQIFDEWREHEAIIELAEPAVMVRPPETRDTLLGALPADHRDAWAKRFVDVDAMDLSSTLIRQRIKTGLPIDGMVKPAVADYIYKNKLYTG